MRSFFLFLFLFLLLCSCSDDLTPSTSTLIINEVMVENSSGSGFLAPNGKYEDWIELYNSGTTPLMLSDYFLTDSDTLLSKAHLPTIALNPGEFITLWCGEKGNDGDLFLGFSLSKKRDKLLLVNRQLEVVDSCLFRGISDLDKGKSFGRFPDAGLYWGTQKYPSPSAPNNG